MSESELLNTVICPQCHADLASGATVCVHCGAPTRSRPATTVHVARLSDERPRSYLDRPWVLTILLLHVGFFGIPLYWKTSYSVGVRLAIITASILYTVFAVAVIGWGVMQIMRLFA